MKRLRQRTTICWTNQHCRESRHPRPNRSKRTQGLLRARRHLRCCGHRSGNIRWSSGLWAIRRSPIRCCSDLSRLQGEVKRVRKVTDREHGPRHVTPAGRSVFYDLFPPEKAAEMERRAQLLIGLEHWLEKSRMTQADSDKLPKRPSTD